MAPTRSTKKKKTGRPSEPDSEATAQVRYFISFLHAPFAKNYSRLVIKEVQDYQRQLMELQKQVELSEARKHTSAQGKQASYAEFMICREDHCRARGGKTT